jgi:hypothetical protein
MTNGFQSESHFDAVILLQLSASVTKPIIARTY